MDKHCLECGKKIRYVKPSAANSRERSTRIDVKFCSTPCRWTHWEKRHPRMAVAVEPIK